MGERFEVEFIFNIDDGVTTPFGDEGIVDTCAVDRGGNRYCVLMAGGEQAWFYEDQLKWSDVAEVPA